MNPILKRRENDLKKLYELENKYSFFKVQNTIGTPLQSIEIFLDLSLPVSKTKTHKGFVVTIELSAKYPLVPPKFMIQPVIYHPHIYDSGTICMGNTWMVSNTLDLEVERLIQLLTFDPKYINPNSLVNFSAYQWYKKNQKKFSFGF